MTLCRWEAQTVLQSMREAVCFLPCAAHSIACSHDPAHAMSGHAASSMTGAHARALPWPVCGCNMCPLRQACVCLSPAADACGLKRCPCPCTPAHVCRQVPPQAQFLHVPVHWPAGAPRAHLALRKGAQDTPGQQAWTWTAEPSWPPFLQVEALAVPWQPAPCQFHAICSTGLQQECFRSQHAVLWPGLCRAQAGLLA